MEHPRVDAGKPAGVRGNCGSCRAGQALARHRSNGTARGGDHRLRAIATRRAGRQTRDRGRTVNELWQRILVGAEQIGNVLPALVGAAVILLTGYVLARQIQRWSDDTLKRLNFNRMASAGGLDEAVVRSGSRLDPIHALTNLLFWQVMLVVILLASTALGLESINEMFGIMLASIPT